MSLKIAIVTESFLPSVNGVTNSVVRVIESLWREGHEVLVISPTATSPTFMGFPVVRTTRLQLKQFPVGLPLLNMSSMLRAFNPDVIHVAAPFLLGRQALSVARRLKIPTVAIYQTDVAGYMKRYKLNALVPQIDRLIAHIHRKATLNLVPTQDARKYFERLGIESVATWARGVDLERFNPERKNSREVKLLRKKLAPNGETVIGFVGRLAAEKQVDRFEEFVNLPNTVIAIVGDGPERAQLEELFSDSNVKFLGKLEGEKLANAYASMDIFVHCGTEETFGQTIQEAQATGLPVVAPRSGGPKHLIKTNVNGFLVNHNDEDAYLEPVQELVSNAKLREQVGSMARSSVLGKSWHANNRVLLEHYQTAIGSNKANARQLQAA